MTLRISWREASARRLERQFLANSPAGGPRPPANVVADVVAAMLGAHAQVPSAAEVAIGMRAAGVTRKDVRAALWEERSLVRTHGPRGTVHLLPADELPLWSAALPALPSGTGPFAPDVRLTEKQAQAGNHPVLLIDGVVAGVWHQARRGRRTTITVEPLDRLTTRQTRELGERAEHVGEVLEATAEPVIGEVTTGPHA
ncbi:DNA glycosylase AlkZ-like family protein [Streptomyces sp. NY05-11A]|uniref:DNA glycosylase AlkZ-like family protein n=1 Tax=Streptomyces soliscabiei TaxID=588897 RepID=UPI0029B62341|nr:crosslink repair DNA glycosylase YcaQ family protein [Streptomyces sp. NY05-11A]MDX2675434.1 crosslink repair DNA glycosylase YcaQ family protein [Streptomyces sp. NY05-11A]